MIPTSYLREWNATAPWSDLRQVEQDLIIYRALCDLFNDPFLAQKIAFRGGTAIHKLLFEKPLRYSEDIDLIQTEAEPIGPTIDVIRKALSWLGKCRTQHAEHLTIRKATFMGYPPKRWRRCCSFYFEKFAPAESRIVPLAVDPPARGLDGEPPSPVRHSGAHSSSALPRESALQPPSRKLDRLDPNHTVKQTGEPPGSAATPGGLYSSVGIDASLRSSPAGRIAGPFPSTLGLLHRLYNGGGGGAALHKRLIRTVPREQVG